MIRSTCLAAAATLALSSVPAQAQDARENNNGLQTGTRFEREPETPDAAKGRWMQKRVANCVFNRDKDAVREILANSDFYSIQFDSIDSDPETLFDDLNVEHCIGRLMRGADNRVYHTYMQIQYSTLRNLLAEEAYLQDFDGPPAVGADTAQHIAERFDGRAVHPQISTMASMVDCMTYRAGAQTHALLRARPGSDDEEEAINALGPVIVSCANTNEDQLQIPTSLIRQMAADGLWSRSYYGSTAAGEG
ncbi:hypothetical protein [Aurantiacibacter rhizosphaerae]|uniref:Uncharacterized protein n=1 Tax=Aurantiacibacter rhizosphaerae TaxID=2691582 RepID=A0A844XDT0_9SPHN|nr:hypothetical protein [Aurantiacibacter rhizosphaerae]MWV27909.1 hypothetical protein [Aurantiacibacter rhizosphaerae]